MGTRNGKLVKKENHELMNLLDMESYPWLHFSEQNIIFPDNNRRTLILEKMHDPVEFKQKIVPANDFNKPFSEKTRPLYPTDLTNDYEQGQREMVKRRRRTLMDEEEAMALELAELEHDGRIKNVNLSRKNKGKKNDETGVHAKDTTFVPRDDNPPRPQPQTPPPLPVVDEKIIEEKYRKAFSEGFEDGKKEGFIKGEEEGKEEGFKKGYDEAAAQGFKSGEERGMAAAESKYERAFENISEAAVRMDEVKSSLLQEGQNIFIELVKLCCERILREKIKGDDAALARLFDEALKAYNSNSTLSIQMNPTDAARIKKHLSSLKDNKKIEIKENESLENGSFHVENDTGVSLVDIKKSIDLIIDSTKNELFKDQENGIEGDLDNKKKVL